MGHTDKFGRVHLNLETRRQRKIDNFQVTELTQLDWASAANTQKKYGHKFVTFVGGPSPIYNCHGLTLGSRRTLVDGAIETILEDDGYEPVAGNPQIPKCGDVVVYYDEFGQVNHTGFVVELIRESNVPKIWSKWGKGHEVIHALYDSPYGDKTRFFRLKPWQKENRIIQV